MILKGLSSVWSTVEVYGLHSDWGDLGATVYEDGNHQYSHEEIDFYFNVYPDDFRQRRVAWETFAFSVSYGDPDNETHFIARLNASTLTGDEYSCKSTGTTPVEVFDEFANDLINPTQHLYCDDFSSYFRYWANLVFEQPAPLRLHGYWRGWVTLPGESFPGTPSDAQLIPIFSKIKPTTSIIDQF